MSITEMFRNNLRFIILVPIIIAGLVFSISLFPQKMYKSSMSLLIVQKQGEEVDALAAVKSAEALADILTRVVASESFRDSVLTNISLDKELSEKPWKQNKEWQKIVKTRNITDTGILIVDTYQPTSKTATKLATSIESGLVKQGYDYLGVSKDSVEIRRLSPPSATSDHAATPNILLNTIVALLIGFIISIGLVILFPEKNFSSMFTSKRSKIKYVEVPTIEFAKSGMIYSDDFKEEKLEKVQDEYVENKIEDDFLKSIGLEEVVSEPEIKDQPPMDLPVYEEENSRMNFVAKADAFVREPK